MNKLKLLQPKEQRKASPVEIRTASNCVVCKMLLALLIPKILQGVGPQQIAHGPVRRGLFESV